MRANDRVMKGETRKIALLAWLGITASLRRSFNPSAKGWRVP
jgi:hypothetical protein